MGSTLLGPLFPAVDTATAMMLYRVLGWWAPAGKAKVCTNGVGPCVEIASRSEEERHGDRLCRCMHTNLVSEAVCSNVDSQGTPPPIGVAVTMYCKITACHGRWDMQL